MPAPPPDSDRKELGALLNRRRRELGYESQVQLAAATGISLRLVRDIEGAAQSRKTLRGDSKARIEDAFQLEVGAIDHFFATGELLVIANPVDPAERLLAEGIQVTFSAGQIPSEIAGWLNSDLFAPSEKLEALDRWRARKGLPDLWNRGHQNPGRDRRSA